MFVVCWKGPWTKSSKVQSPIFILEFNSSPKTNFQPLKLLPGAGRGGRWTGKRDRLKTLTWRSICAVPNLTPHNMTYARDTNTDSFFWIKGNFKLGWDNISLFYTSLKNKQYNFLMSQLFFFTCWLLSSHFQIPMSSFFFQNPFWWW